MITFEAKNYSDRMELEKAVSLVLPLTPDKKDAVIKGKESEFKRLQLSDDSIFWGIICEITDKKIQPKNIERPQRGEVFNSLIK